MPVAIFAAAILASFSSDGESKDWLTDFEQTTTLTPSSAETSDETVSVFGQRLESGKLPPQLVEAPSVKSNDHGVLMRTPVVETTEYNLEPRNSLRPLLDHMALVILLAAELAVFHWLT